MKIVLATGIYPPDIGGPATYVRELARELTAMGHAVTVLTYQTIFVDQDPPPPWTIVRIPRSTVPLWTWKNYADALKKHASDADAVICFSSVSCGVPLWMSGIAKPKRMLRLGGDFFWERYTAVGGELGLREWYGRARPSTSGDRFNLWLTRLLNAMFMQRLLNCFHHVVYSTDYQRQIHHQHYQKLPNTLVIQNALPGGQPALHSLHTPVRLLFLGRFVRFKNVGELLKSLRALPNATLTMTGEGPERRHLMAEAQAAGIASRVTFMRPVFGEDKKNVFANHDVLVLPSITEISPNAALETRSAGLPVLLTEETGLSGELTKGMVKAPLRTAEEIARAVTSVLTNYDAVSRDAAGVLLERTWKTVAEEWVKLFSR